MLQAIAIADLPLTFQHAVSITYSLGYRYLWIDSLCIMQDDPSDWAFESATMSRIYSNSVLTIAALWGEDSHSGCFVERNPLLTQDCSIGKWKHGDVFVESGRRDRGQSLYGINPTPLLGRAWVTQERFLSPRTLFYGPWELLWECGKRSGNETEPDRTETFFEPEYDMLKSRFMRIARVDPVPTPSPVSQSSDLWQSIWRFSRKDAKNRETSEPRSVSTLEEDYGIWVEWQFEYWSSKLTYHTDSLVAISGIITRLEQRSSLHFKFGLCKEFLPSELLWAVDNPNQSRRSTLSPTWSWASVEGATVKRAYSYKYHSKRSIFHTWVESIDDTFAMSPNPASYGLHLSGPLLHTTLTRNQSGHFRTTHDRLQEYGYKPDFPLPDTIDVVCLVIVEVERDREWYLGIDPGGVAPAYIGLMLVPDPREASMYKRVGVWSQEQQGHPWGTEKHRLAITPADIRSIRLI